MGFTEDIVKRITDFMHFPILQMYFDQTLKSYISTTKWSFFFSLQHKLAGYLINRLEKFR